jgi:hypothetical protein
MENGIGKSPEKLFQKYGRRRFDPLALLGEEEGKGREKGAEPSGATRR